MNTTPLRPPNASAVSRLLAKAGFERSETEASSMRNATYYTPGFEVRGPNQSWEWSLLDTDRRDAGYVTVSRCNIDTFGHQSDEKRPLTEVVAETMSAYSKTLEDAGYEVEFVDRAAGSFLVIKGRQP